MQTPNVLIVEDEVVTRTTLKSLFEAEGYNVFEAENGNQMHDFFENHAINLVIMDINLPGKNGLILAREVRDRKNVGLIFLTGRDNDVDRILGLEIGADDYLTKPFNPREQKFIDQMVSFCGKKTATQVAIDSGYGIPGARTRASELMTRADIRDEIDVRLEEIRKKWLVTKDQHYQELGNCEE